MATAPAASRAQPRRGPALALLRPFAGSTPEAARRRGGAARGAVAGLVGAFFFVGARFFSGRRPGAGAARGGGASAGATPRRSSLGGAVGAPEGVEPGRRVGIRLHEDTAVWRRPKQAPGPPARTIPEDESYVNSYVDTG
eukprot:scaffold6039_cov384-Prasinococcus_capsulatus_cf.AAC.4